LAWAAGTVRKLTDTVADELTDLLVQELVFLDIDIAQDDVLLMFS
jgi:hypothetical protein